MKILIIGSDKSYAIERAYLKYFREYGYEVSVYPAQTYFFDYLQKSIVNKIAFRIGLKWIYKIINTELRKQIVEVDPDVLFIFKGMEIFPESLKWARLMGIKTYNYNPDNPFLFSGRGSGNSNITASIGLYDAHFTYNLKVKSEMESSFDIPTYWIPFGFDLSEIVYESLMLEAEINKICFVGNPDRHRIQFLKELADNGFIIDLYGVNWQRFIQHKNISIHAPVFADEMWSILRKYRVQLNPLRIHNLDSHGMRSFEIPAVGGIMLAPRTSEHQMLFTEGKEAFYYSSTEEAMNHIKKLLSLNQGEADKIRRNARLRSVSSGYGYKNRAKEILDIIESVET